LKKPSTKICKKAPIKTEHVNQVVNWILEGNSEFDLLGAIRDKLGGHSANDLLLKAAEHFQAAGNTEPIALRGFCIESYREIYRKALDIGDYTTALKALSKLEASAK